jgi:hypothetical protein
MERFGHCLWSYEGRKQLDVDVRKMLRYSIVGSDNAAVVVAICSLARDCRYGQRDSRYETQYWGHVSCKRYFDANIIGPYCDFKVVTPYLYSPIRI